MKARDGSELLALGALWGASFLFMRLGAAEFGPVTLSALRVGLASALLLPLLLWRGQAAALRAHWRTIAFVGVINSALPFVLFSIAALAINTGLSAILNATAPLWGALIAWVWLGERLSRARTLGLAIGFAGVLWLAWDKASLKPGEQGVSAGVAIAACLLATLCYGFAAHYVKRHLQGVAPMAVAAGSQLAATVALALPAWWLWPATPPSALAWASAVGLAVLCTALAYLLYFRLIANLGAAGAVSVTYLIPAFGLLWGALFLGESLTPTMLVGCVVILLGTALATGALKGLVRRAT
ncbi:MAG: DMT family transporter [Pseudomonadota bacterium]